MNTVPFRYSLKNMEIKSRQVQIGQQFRLIQSLQPSKRPFIQILPHPLGAASLKQFGEPLMFEAYYHASDCSNTCYSVNRFLTGPQRQYFFLTRLAEWFPKSSLFTINRFFLLDRVLIQLYYYVVILTSKKILEKDGNRRYHSDPNR